MRRPDDVSEKGSSNCHKLKGCEIILGIWLIPFGGRRQQQCGTQESLADLKPQVQAWTLRAKQGTVGTIFRLFGLAPAGNEAHNLLASEWTLQQVIELKTRSVYNWTIVNWSLVSNSINKMKIFAINSTFLLPQLTVWLQCSDRVAIKLWRALIYREETRVEVWPNRRHLKIRW